MIPLSISDSSDCGILYIFAKKLREQNPHYRRRRKTQDTYGPHYKPGRF